MTPAPSDDKSRPPISEGTELAPRTVTFCMQWIPQYREGFYEALSPVLRDQGVSMIVVHGDPPTSRRRRQDHVRPAWALHRRNSEFRVRGVELTWQRAWSVARSSDLVIVQQEAGLLFNYVALIHRRLGGPKVAMWGHGEFTDETKRNALAEQIKRLVTPSADWFFGYTERSAEIVRSIGMPGDRITVVNNSKAEDQPGVEPPDPLLVELIEKTRQRTRFVGWMSSALDESKRLDLLIDVLDAVRKRLPTFEFFVIGSGEYEPVLHTAAESRPWLHVVGTRFGADKRSIAELASITIHPGLLGLHVIDAFQTQTPIITQDGPWHSHEFAYLDDSNAVVLDASAGPHDLASAAVELLCDPERLDELRRGCSDSADRFSLRQMVDNFAEGVLSALDSPRNRKSIG